MPNPSDTSKFEAQPARIRLLLLDVDGVLTDGRLAYIGEHEEIKTFHVRDGLGIKLLQSAGVQVGIVTARVSKALQRRCRELGIDLIFDGIKDKGSVLEPILQTYPDLKLDQIAFMGDDLVDLPLMRRVGTAIAVADAEAVVKAAAQWVTTRKGGAGAVREVADEILKALGIWDRTVRQFNE